MPLIFNAANGGAQDFASGRLLTWRDGAQLGGRITYHVGALAHDRASPAVPADARRVPEAAAASAWALYLSGRVQLVQKRLGADVFAYIAVATQSDANLDYTTVALERSWQSRKHNGADGAS